MKLNQDYLKYYVLVILMFCIAISANSQTYFNITGGNVNHTGGAIILEDTNFINNGIYAGTGSVSLLGSTTTTIEGSGTTTFNDLIIDKTSSAVSLGSDITVVNNLTLTNGKILLQDSDLTFEAAASISNYNATNYLVTEGLGTVIKNDLTTAFEFPVGFNQNTYNPIEITQNGAVDNISVRCLEHVLEQGNTGNAFTTNVVDASWEVNETLAGGSSLDIVAQWDLSDELTDFDRNNSGISYQDGASWNMNTTDIGNAIGSDPYSQFRTNITDTGIFAVGNENLMTILLSPVVFLQGAGVNPTIGEELLMRDDLRVAGLLPTTSPYADGLTCDASVFNTTGTDAIVDWIWVEIRDSNDSSIVIESRSALLQRDGDVVAEDGISEVKFTSLSNAYYVAINHRSHLGVLSAVSNQLAGTTMVNLSADQATVYGGNNAVTQLLNGSYAMYGGDFNQDEQILNSDISGALLLSGTSSYSTADVDMNGQILNTDITLIIQPNTGKGQQF